MILPFLVSLVSTAKTSPRTITSWGSSPSSLIGIGSSQIPFPRITFGSLDAKAFCWR